MLQNTFIAIILTTTVIAAASAFHYKVKFDSLSTQTHINDKNTINLVRDISQLVNDIHLVSHHSDCSEMTQAVIGAECDLGNYMEWAGPELKKEAEELSMLINSASVRY